MKLKLYALEIKKSDPNRTVYLDFSDDNDLEYYQNITARTLTENFKIAQDARREEREPSRLICFDLTPSCSHNEYVCCKECGQCNCFSECRLDKQKMNLEAGQTIEVCIFCEMEFIMEEKDNDGTANNVCWECEYCGPRSDMAMQ